MRNIKILVTPTSFLKPENAQAKELLESFAGEVVYNDLGRPLKGEEILERLRGADGYIAGLDYITADVIEAMPESVKTISRYGAGVDRVDMDAAKKRGITVTNTPGTNAVAVCELAFALMLCAARSIPRLDAAVRKGEWPRNEGIELLGKTLGIIGLGAIGRNLALRAKAFGMNVMAYDPYIDTQFLAQENIAGGSGAGDLDRLLRGSDFISLHVPLMDSTRHMIDAAAIAKLPDRAVVINTARGGIVDEQAVAEALKSGKLSAVCMDAFEQEPVTDSPLLDAPNVIMTPHTGAHTNEAVAGMGMMAVKNAIAVLTGEECPYILNR